VSSTPIIKKLAVIGVGLIGGSFALALKQAGAVEQVVGIDRDQANLDLALQLGVVDEAASDLACGLKDVQVVFLAVPVRSIATVTAEIAPYLPKGCIVTDGGSVKDELVKLCEPLMPEGCRFVGGHPIAGTEHSGAAAAFPTLYQGRRSILTPTQKTDPEALEVVCRLWQAAGSRVECMDAVTHDRIFAAVSHLPHMVAYALVHAVDRSAEEEENILAFSAGGFKDFTRIASSDPAMWRDIALMNQRALLDMLDRYLVEITALRERVATSDGQWLEEFFRTSKRLRDEIV
jgi:prephenate dehydrogenase